MDELIEQVVDEKMKVGTSLCECGQKQNYVISPFIMPERRVCPACGRLHYVDGSLIEWDKVNNTGQSRRRRKI